MSNSKTTDGYGYDSWRDLSERLAVKDALPEPLRRLIDEAPHKLAPEAVDQKYRQLGDVDRTLRWYASFFERIKRERAHKAWGPLHPDAQF